MGLDRRQFFKRLVNAGDKAPAAPSPEQQQLNDAVSAETLREVRQVAPDYVSSFMTEHAGTPIIGQLQEAYGIDDLDDLEALLKDQIRTWINESNDRLIRQYDVVSVRDLVFTQLRSWC